MFDDLKNKEHRYFHVTPKKNLSAIQKEGLLAQIGDRSQEAKEDAEAVFLFPSKEDMDNALLNWLGQAFEEEDELIILQIDLPAVARAVGYQETFSVDSVEQLAQAVREAQQMQGPILIEARVKKGNRKDLGRPTTTPVQNKEALMAFLKK